VIIRVFRAWIHPGKEDEFERFVRETGVPIVCRRHWRTTRPHEAVGPAVVRVLVLPQAGGNGWHGRILPAVRHNSDPSPQRPGT